MLQRVARMVHWSRLDCYQLGGLGETDPCSVRATKGLLYSIIAYRNNSVPINSAITALVIILVGNFIVIYSEEKKSAE